LQRLRDDLPLVKEYLLNSVIEPVNPDVVSELRNYVEEAFYRFMMTLEIIPHDGNNRRLLDLGANPYFLTLLLKRTRNYELTLAN
jgi:hypothetical protein